MKDNREEFLHKIRHTPDTQYGLKEDFVKIVSRNRQPQTQQTKQVPMKDNITYTAPKGTAKNAKEKGISKRGQALIMALLVAGTLGFSTLVHNINSSNIPTPAPIVQQQNKPRRQNEQSEKMIENLMNAKKHYEKGYNLDFESITEENMNDELKKIRELLKMTYKSRIADLYGIKPEDAIKITGKVDVAELDIRDKHSYVYIPEDISPTGEAIELEDEQIPENILSMIRLAGKVKSNLDFRYNNPDHTFGRAVYRLGTAINMLKTQNYIDTDGSLKQVEEKER